MGELGIGFIGGCCGFLPYHIRASKEYWGDLKVASGRPDCPCCSKPMNWGVTQGDDILKQQECTTTKEEIEKLAAIREEKKQAVAA